MLLNMKFCVGYQLPDEQNSITDCILDYKEHVAEVYFPWVNMPSGRSPLGAVNGYTDWSAQGQLVDDLKRIKQSGIRLDLVLNANCMGGDALAVSAMNRINSVLDYLEYESCGADVVTTASLAVAHTVKSRFPHIDLRASVNMRIGNVKSAEYVKDLFDSFYLQREYNRDFDRIKEMKAWSGENGKQMHFLVNSGCLDHCSGQTFHDNLVAHEGEISGRNNIDFVPHICRQYFKKPENLVSVLQNCWIRPEDISNYDEYFSMAKLATRQHQNPSLVLIAYIKGRYYGNLLDLLEPSNADIIYPTILDNSRFPQDWHEKTTTCMSSKTSKSCKKDCGNCGYCKSVLDLIAVQDG